MHASECNTLQPMPSREMAFYILSKFSEVMSISKDIVQELRNDSNGIIDALPQLKNAENAGISESGSPVELTRRPGTTPASRANRRRKRKGIDEFSREEKFVSDLGKGLASMETHARMKFLESFIFMGSYCRTFYPPTNPNWDILKRMVPVRNITLNGPYPGLIDTLMPTNLKKPRDPEKIKRLCVCHKSMLDLAAKNSASQHSHRANKTESIITCKIGQRSRYTNGKLLSMCRSN